MDPLREQLARSLGWEDAHASFESATKGLPESLRGKVPDGLAWSCWQLVEHLRITQRDILEFCIDPAYEERKWPDDYWPQGAAPESAEQWERSLREFAQDRDQLMRLAKDPASDLFAPIPHGTGQTLLRELILVIDHNAYHIGQLIAVRRILGAWPPS
jgi:uncharacterized damage-inducible protein DinB